MSTRLLPAGAVGSYPEGADTLNLFNPGGLGMTRVNEVVLFFDFSLDQLEVSLRADGPDWAWAHRA